MGGILGATLAMLLQTTVPPQLQVYINQVEEIISGVMASGGSRVAEPELTKVWRWTVVPSDTVLEYKDFFSQQPDYSSELAEQYGACKLSFYSEDQTSQIERGNEMLVARAVHEGVRQSDLYVGNTVSLEGQCFTVTAHGDQETRRAGTQYRQSTLALVKPDALPRAGEFLSLIRERTELSIAKMRLLRLSSAQARTFYQEHRERAFFGELVDYMTSGPILALHLVGPNSVSAWRTALGPTDSNEARRSASQSVRAALGTDKQRNAGHGSDSQAAATREVEFFFPCSGCLSDGPVPSLPSASELLDATSCLVLPHVIRQGELGDLLSSLSRHHASSLLRAELVQLNYRDAARYSSGRLMPTNPPQREAMTALLAGPAVVIRVGPADTNESEKDFLKRFKDITGPRDPVRARKAAVGSIRAQFGKDKFQNALLCPWYDWDALPAAS